MNIVVFLIFSIIGFFIARFFAGKKTGEQGRLKSLIFKKSDYVIHLHHWVVFLLLLILFLFLHLYMDFFFGFFVGGIVQGLTYRDFYRVVYKENL